LNKSDPKYVRVGPPPAGDDLRLYDGGSLYFATSGCTNTTQIGKLEVTYRFEMGLPTLLNQGVGGVVASNTAFFQNTTAQNSGATTVPVQLLLATASANGLGAVNTAGSIVPPMGNYQLGVQVTAGQSGEAALTGVILDVQKNGVSLFTVKPQQFQQAGAVNDNQFASIAATVIVSCSGTDALTVIATPSYTGGTCQLSGTLTIVPV
jgi:hypothetical protein